MGRGARREPIFSVPGARSTFLQLLSELPERFGVAVHAYAVMGNHYHLLVTSPEGRLAGPMQRLDQTFTQRLNGRHGWDGPVFRGRYTDVLVCEPEHWHWLLAYVHLNPERVGLANRVSDPLWTSHAAYLRDGELRRWLDTTEFLQMHRGEQRYAQWLSDVSLGALAPPDSFLPERPVSGMAVVPPRVKPGDAEQLLAVLEGVIGRSVPRGRSVDPVAQVAAWWLRFHGVKQAEVARRLGVQRTAVVKRVARALVLADEDAAVAGWMAALSGSDRRSEAAA